MSIEFMGEKETALSGLDPVEAFYADSGLGPDLLVSEMAAGHSSGSVVADREPISQLPPELEEGPEALRQPDPDRMEAEHDIGSFAFIATRAAEQATEASAETDSDVERADRSKEVFQVEWDKNSFEIKVESELTLEDYKRQTPPEVWDLLEQFMNELKGKEMTFVNPTMQGGGVAIMRPAFVHLINLFGKEQERQGAEKGVRAHWFKMADHKELNSEEIRKLHGTEIEGNPFVFTKQMHNINQRRKMPEGQERITEEGKALHQKWGEENWKVLGEQDAFVNADIMIIDDPQPVPLIPRLRAANPDQLLFWRNHIDTNHKPGELMEDPSTPQGEVWQYLWESGIKLTDGTFVHPVRPENPDDNPAKGNAYGPDLENTWVVPAVIEQNDDLNRELNEEEIEEGFNFINAEIEAKNKEYRAKKEFQKVQELVDPDRDIILLVARFDESKGMDHAIKLGEKTRAEMREQLQQQGLSDEEIEERLPQVVIIGNGSVDDPSGGPMLEKIYEERNELENEDDRSNTIVMRLKHNYQAINAMMYKAKVLMQTSEAEGMETRITDGTKHGLTSYVFNNGGMSTQIVEGRSGEILDFQKPDHDLPRGAKMIAGLLLDREELARRRQATLEVYDEFNRVDFAIPMGLLRFSRAFVTKMKDRNAKADGKWLHGDIVEAEKAKQKIAA